MNGSFLLVLLTIQTWYAKTNHRPRYLCRHSFKTNKRQAVVVITSLHNGLDTSSSSFFDSIVNDRASPVLDQMQPGGQSIVDRFLAAKNTIAGQALAKVVCKATTEEMMGPKRKHLDCKCCCQTRLSWKIPRSSRPSDERNECVHSGSRWSSHRTCPELVVGGVSESLDHHSSFNVLRQWGNLNLTISFGEVFPSHV